MLLVAMSVSYAEEPTPSPQPSATLTPEGPRVTRIFISGDLLNEVFGLPTERTTLASYLGSLTVYADGKKCVTASLTDSKGLGVRPDAVMIPEPYRLKEPYKSSTGEVIVVGASGQPDVCRKEGATLTLVDGQGRELWQEFEVKAGVTYELTSVGPKPPSSGETDSGTTSNTESSEPSSSDWLTRGAIGAVIGALIGLGAASVYVLRRRIAGRGT